MALTQIRWAILLIVVVTFILAMLLGVVVLPNRFKGEYDTDFSKKYPELATLISTRTPRAEALLSTITPPPQNAGSDLVIATVTLQPNCTRSALYWVNHPELWPEKIDLGNALFTKTQALQIIQSAEVDASNLLFVHFAAAYLNVIYGAEPLAIAGDIMQASEWLYEHPPGGEKLLDPDVQQAIALAKNLEEYNAGYLSPMRCLDDPSSYADWVGGIPVPVLSTTPSILLTGGGTSTQLATITASPTRMPTLVLSTYRPPTATATPKPDKPPKSNPTSPPPVETEPPPVETEPPPVETEPPPRPTERPRPTEPPPRPTEPPPPVEPPVSTEPPSSTEPPPLGLTR